jgi:hypothetical protein
MRIGALLFVGLGFLAVAACNGPTSNDEECLAAGGVCVTHANCNEQLSGLENTCTAVGTSTAAATVCCTPRAGDAGAATPVADTGTATKG